MRIGSLFSGVGGLELGLEWAGLGHTVWQVEQDPRCRRVLAKYWPGVTQHNDVRSVGRTTLDHVDLICGGFPCQDVSSAGKRAGLAGARSGLWFEYLRIVQELAPRWVVVENVASGARAWVDTVRSGLGQLGYASLPIPISACDVGAYHRRARVFIVATTDTHTDWGHAGPLHAEVAGAQAFADPITAELRIEPGRGGWADRLGKAEPANDRESTAPAHAHTPGRKRSGGGASPTGRPRPTASHWRAPMPNMVRVVHGVPRRMDGARQRIAALGNAVVPQCAEVVGHVIQLLREGAP